VGPVYLCRGGFPCAGWQVGKQDLLGSVKRPPLRVQQQCTQLLWWSCCAVILSKVLLLAICYLWESVTSSPWTDNKKRFGGGFFFYFCQCDGFASNMGARSIECMFFFPFLPLHNLFFRPCRSLERRHPHITQS
jgi:hypothetical protein